MRRLSFFFSVATVAAIATTAMSCKNMGYKKTKSGLEYKIISGNSSSKDSTLKAGDLIKFNIIVNLERKGKADSILGTTYNSIPGYFQVDTSERVKYNFPEVLPLAKVGDSLDFRISVDSLVSRKLMPDYQPPFEKGAFIVGHVRILKKFANQQEIQADNMAEVNAFKGKLYNQVKTYLSDKKINATQTKDSAFVLVENPGDQTLKADSGMQASVKYKGYLMDGGKVFDSNIDSVPGRPKHLDPINIVVGSHMVIPGWEAGLPYFGKGGKGKIFIPAYLAYGQNATPDIPAWSNLIFDIEVVDVKKAPAQKAAPSMPQIRSNAAPQGAK